MFFIQNSRCGAATLYTLLLVGCSATALAPMTSIMAIQPIAQTPPIIQSVQTTQAISPPKQDNPSFIKIVDVKRNPGLCVTAEMHSEVLIQVNQIRAQGAVCGNVRYPPAKPLRWSTKLQRAADKHSQDMAMHNFFNHKSASNGSTLPERLRNEDYNYRDAGENIGAGPATVAQVMDMWVASPAHCVNLMTAHFAELGVSCKNNSNSKYKTYWTLNAAAPI